MNTTIETITEEQCDDLAREAAEANDDEMTQIAKLNDATQFARDYNWEDTPGMIDAEHAADAICAELESDDPELRVALVASAERETVRRASR